MCKTIAIVVITYNPNLEELIKNIKSYITQVNLIVVVDNSTLQAKQEEVQKQLSLFDKVALITLGDNFGIAYGQNVGIKFVLDQEYSFFVEIDQDSQLPSDYVASMINAFELLTKNGEKIGGIGPVAVNKKTGSPYHNRLRYKGIVEAEYTLSSGFLVSSDAYKIIGSKNEDLFIDYVDWEWCWRARKCGYKIFVNTDIAIEHMLGRSHMDFYFLKFGVSAPIRHYYQFRNVFLLITVGYVPLYWKISNIIKLLFKLVAYPLILDSGLERLKYMINGIQDGILRQKGRIR